MYVMDRGYERYALFEQIVRAQSDYLCRVQHRSRTVLEQRPVSEEGREAGVLRDELVQPGRSRTEVGSITHPVRRITLAQTGPGRRRNDRPQHEEIILLTNLREVPAEVLAAIYRLRWSIELFFRFFKHVLGCRHLLSHRPEGVAIQVYCALIAALLMSLATGQSLGRRGFELVCLYFQGWAEEDELLTGLERLSRKKNKT
jgi:IS4 transposase